MSEDDESAFFFLKRKDFHRRHPFTARIHSLIFLQTSLQLLQGELAVKPRAEFNKTGTESYSGAAAALPFLADRIAFFLASFFSPFLSFSGRSM